MSIVLTRKRDDRKLNLTWSYLISPVNASMLGNYVQSTEAAHPFRVEADSVACAFVEYSDPTDSSGIKIRRICSDLIPSLTQIAQNHTFDEAKTAFYKSPEYMDAKNSLLSDFFWEIGKYSVDVAMVRFNNPSQGEFMAWYLRSEWGQKDLLKNKRGGGKLGLGLDDIRDTPVPVVSNETAQKTVAYIDDRLSVCDSIEHTVDAAIQQAEAMRQSILKDAFEGRI